MNIYKIATQFNTQAKCLDYLTKLRWDGKPKCPFCKKSKVRIVNEEKGMYFCKACKRQFSVFTDTIFEGTLLPLPKWFAAIVLVLHAKSGMASKELERHIGMLLPNTKLHGIIEMDESYFACLYPTS